MGSNYESSVERLSRVEDFIPGQLVQWDWVPNGLASETARVAMNIGVAAISATTIVFALYFHIASRKWRRVQAEREVKPPQINLT